MGVIRGFFRGQVFFSKKPGLGLVALRLQPPAVTFQPLSVTLQLPLVALQPPSVTPEVPSVGAVQI